MLTQRTRTNHSNAPRTVTYKGATYEKVGGRLPPVRDIANKLLYDPKYKKALQRSVRYYTKLLRKSEFFDQSLLEDGLNYGYWNSVFGKSGYDTDNFFGTPTESAGNLEFRQLENAKVAVAKEMWEVISPILEKHMQEIEQEVQQVVDQEW